MTIVIKGVGGRILNDREIHVQPRGNIISFRVA